MTALRLLVPGIPKADAELANHAKATLTSSALVVTFPYLDAEGDLADLARDWVEQGRPGNRKPLTRPGSPKLAKVSLTATFANPDDTQFSVEEHLGILRAMAGSDQPVVASFGGLLADTHWTASGRWVIQSLSIHPKARRHVDNAVTRAEASIDLLEANIPGWTPSPSTFRYVSSIAGAGTGRPRTWLVSEGQTLWSIAWAIYGDPTRWIALGDANGILNPAALTVGRVLVVP